MTAPFLIGSDIVSSCNYYCTTMSNLQGTCPQRLRSADRPSLEGRPNRVVAQNLNVPFWGIFCLILFEWFFDDLFCFLNTFLSRTRGIFHPFFADVGNG